MDPLWETFPATVAQPVPGPDFRAVDQRLFTAHVNSEIKCEYDLVAGN
jgi:hypothetical protein